MPLPPNVARTLLALSAGITLAGCNAADSRGGPEWLAAKAEPVTLTLDYESDNRAVRTITETGGTIVATAEDGTRFRLQIPAGALLAPTVITMTPVASVKGLPLAGEGGYATVHLEPDGLQLMKPAVLSIRSKRKVPPARQVAFAYHGDGEDAHLYPLGTDPTKVELKLLHFSGYGFGEAPSDDPGRRALQRAASVEARLASQVAAAINRERERGTAEGMSDEIMGEMGSFLVAYYDEVLAPLLKEAETNDKMVNCAFQKHTSWIRQGMLLGLIDDSSSSADPELDRRVAAANKSAAAMMQNFFDKTAERALRLCRDDHDFSFPVTLVSMVRQRMLLGETVETSKQMAKLIDDIENVNRQCMRFEVEFETTFDKPHLGGGGVSYSLFAKVPFVDTVMHAGAIPIGEGAITHTAFIAKGNPGTGMFGANSGPGQLLSGTISPAGTRDGVFKVLDFAYEVSPRRPTVDCAGEVAQPEKNPDGTEKKQKPSSFAIVFAPGIPTEITHYRSLSPLTKLGGRSSWNDEAAEWAEDWATWHESEQVLVPGFETESRMAGGAYRIMLDSVAPGKWQVEYRRHDETGHLFEKSIITVRHKP